VNVKAFDALPKEYQAIFEAACADANDWISAKYDSSNPAALKRLLSNGVKLQGFSNEILAACYKASTDAFDEIATKNAKFRKVYEPWRKFRDEQVQWFSIAENRFDNFMVSAQRMAQKGGKKG
jgi:TRAP-type mannitol/chloroaromatic compound transport system substrate-binding protein